MAVEIRFGDRGEAVRDLTRRLLAAGFDPGTQERATFGTGTRLAVEAFQRSRHLPVTGRCDAMTWAVLVEAGYRLGDRLLYHRSPMLRGEDVASLQQRLSGLGFDAGRIDGIYGPLTASAIEELQRNVGIVPDGICGPDTLAALDRVARARTDAVPIAAVREREMLRGHTQLSPTTRVVLAHDGGHSGLVRVIARRLRRSGAPVLTLDETDGSAQAAAANGFRATVFLVVRAVERSPSVAYYATDVFTSEGGRRLATLLCDELATLDRRVWTAAGLRLPALRETRMPAVSIDLGDTSDMGSSLDVSRVGRSVERALGRWMAPAADPDQLPLWTASVADPSPSTTV